MDIQMKREDGCRRIVTASSTASEVEQEFAAVINEYCNAGVPGFRIGHAPLSVIKKHFHDEITDTTGKRAAARLLSDVLSERDMERVGPANFTAIEFSEAEGVTFTVEFDEAPEIDLPDFRAFRPSPQARSDADRKNELSHYLLSPTFDLPQSLIELELRFAGADQDDREGATQRVKLLLVLQSIARSEGIEVDEQDLAERIAQMAEQSGMAAETLRTELAQNNGLERLRLFLLAEETMDYVLTLSAES